MQKRTKAKAAEQGSKQLWRELMEDEEEDGTDKKGGNNGNGSVRKNPAANVAGTVQ